MFVRILNQNKALNQRKETANKRLEEIRLKFDNNGDIFRDKPLSVFCAGSLARKDVGKLSDLDLFILSGEEVSKRSRLEEVEILSAIIGLNRELGYKSFSNDGEYLKVYSEKDMIKALGAPRDDAENLFTARMLLLLESCPVCNSSQYEQFLDETINHYFRDSRGRKSFRPLFLLNDILRWWRTVCLNYELVRDEPGRPWRKKNINLKFSRMLTVFGTVLPLIAKPMKHAEDLREIAVLTPHERFARGLDVIGDESLKDD
ncbi:MAG: nucleotidyltransferase domain-containing protein, partial [Candidatus Thiodiazotropha endolucinida]